MNRFNGVLLASAAVLLMQQAGAAGGLVESVARGCDKELNSYCSNVTPGQGRILACLYAHQDKLSGQCEYALYDAAVQLERAVSALSYLANECDTDLEKLCTTVEPGEGRVLQCLNDNRGKLSERCRSAMEDIDLKAE